MSLEVLTVCFSICSAGQHYKFGRGLGLVKTVISNLSVKIDASAKPNEQRNQSYDRSLQYSITFILDSNLARSTE